MDKIKKILILLLFIFIFPVSASAADLYLSPNSGSYDIGKTFSVSIYVSSPDQAMNAASGVINFSTEKLEVLSISKTNSIFSLWAKEPSFSNIAGTVSFEGVILSPGFTGNSGKILTINFKTKKAGEETISFSSGSILANDGNGTDITSNKRTAQFSIIDNNSPTEEKPVVALKIPAAPNISSSTHPDQEKWYNSNNVKLSWEVPSDVDKIRILLNKSPNSTPSIIYDPSVKERGLNDLDDGIWYFHVQFRNDLGWGTISHFKIQIDTVAPEPFKINFITGKNGETSHPIVTFETTDSLSGIDYYKIRIGEENPINISTDEIKNGEYTLPDQSPGTMILMVRAFDKAGNYFSTADEFTVNSLDSPIITEYQKELTSQDFLYIKGLSKYPQSQVNIYFEKDNKLLGIKKVITDSSGNFYLAYEGNLKSGVYNIKAEIVNNDGLKSVDNQMVSIVVKDPYFIKIKDELKKIVIPLTTLILIIIVCFIYLKSKLAKRKLKKEILEAENASKESFEYIKDILDNKIKTLLRNKIERGLTNEEARTIKKIKESIDSLDKLMKKEIDDIEKEIK